MGVDMAEITFSCPGCRQELEAPEEMAGEIVECPNCQKQITIPKPQKAAGKISVAAALASKAAPAASAGKSGNKCPECGADMMPGSVLCIQCGFNVKLGQKMTTELS